MLILAPDDLTAVHPNAGRSSKTVTRLLNSIWGTFMVTFCYRSLWKSLEKYSKYFGKIFTEKSRGQNRTKNRTIFSTQFSIGYLSSFCGFWERKGPTDPGMDQNLETYFVILAQGQAIGSLIDRG